MVCGPGCAGGRLERESRANGPPAAAPWLFVIWALIHRAIPPLLFPHKYFSLSTDDGKIAFITQSRTKVRSRWSNDLDIVWRHRGAPLPKEVGPQTCGKAFEKGERSCMPKLKL